MTLSYEDESGNVSEVTKDLELEVVEPMEDDMAMMDMPEEEKGLPILPIIVILVVIVVAAAVVIIIKKKKKKQMVNEEEELLYELDGPSEDEHQ